MPAIDHLIAQNDTGARSLQTAIYQMYDLLGTRRIKLTLSSITLMRASKNKSYTGYQFMPGYYLFDKRLLSPLTLGAAANPMPYDKFYPSGNSQGGNVAAQAVMTSQDTQKALYNWALGRPSPYAPMQPGG